MYDPYKEIQDNAKKYSKILKLTDKKIKELEKIPVKTCDEYYEDIPNELATIKVSEIVGTCRSEIAKNWYELLGSLHKLKTINQCNADNFHDFLNYVQEEGLPEVVEYKNEYYIAGDGKHRLAIARCKDEPTAVVALKKINE